MKFARRARRGPRRFRRRDEAEFHRALDTLSDLSQRAPSAAAGTSPAEELELERTASGSFVFTDEALKAPVPPTSPRARRALRRATRPSIGVVLPVVAALAVTGAIVGVIAASGGHHPSSSPPPSHTTTSTPRNPATTTTTTTSPTTTSTTMPPTSTTLAGAVPVLSGLVPSSGTAGEQVTITGSRIASSNGSIVATFNGHVAPTRCPSEQSCTATVPAGLSGSVAVALKTSAGSSNSLTFTYR